MKRTQWRLMAVLLFGLNSVLARGATNSVAVNVAAGELNIVHDGTSDYAVVISAAASPTERTAASELVGHIQKMTGVRLEVMSTNDAPACPAIFLGRSPASAARFPDLPADLGPDAFELRSNERDIVVIGGNDRGLLYGVYEMLGAYWGCRWWTHTESTIPRHDRLTFPAKKRDRQAPAFAYRDTNYRYWLVSDGKRPALAPCVGLWNARNRLNGHNSRCRSDYGGAIRFRGYGHGMGEYVAPYAKCFKEHPEWFAQVNGKTLDRGKRSQYNFTSPGLFVHTRDLILQMATNPISPNDPALLAGFSVGMADSNYYDDSPESRAIVEREGTVIGPNLDFANRIAAELEKVRPDALVQILAYNDGMEPPRQMRARDNVMVQVVPIRHNQLYPIEYPTNAVTANQLRGWARKCKVLHVWMHLPDFNEMVMPYPNAFSVGPDIRFLRKAGGNGYFAEMGDVPGDMMPLKNWLIARMLWNPDADPDALIGEFLNGYYGAAGPYLLQYMQAVKQSAVETDAYIYGNGIGTRYLTLGLMNKATRLFRQAEAAVAGDAELVRRVRIARMPVDYVWLNLYPSFRQAAKAQGVAFEGPPDFQKACDDFIDMLKVSDTTILRRGDGRDVVVQIQDLKMLQRTVSRRPEEYAGLPESRFFDLQDNLALLGTSGQMGSKAVKDERASDGVTVCVRNMWNYQMHVKNAPALADLTGKPVTAYASIRVEKDVLASSNFTGLVVGMHDVGENRGNFKHYAKTGIPDDGYHAYEIGKFTLNDSVYFYAGADGGGMAVNPPVLVDRFFIVVE